MFGTTGLSIACTISQGTSSVVLPPELELSSPVVVVVVSVVVVSVVFGLLVELLVSTPIVVSWSVVPPVVVVGVGSVAPVMLAPESVAVPPVGWSELEPLAFVVESVGWLIGPFEVSESLPLLSSLQANGRSAQYISLMATLRIEG